jgi:hypothetical protein
MRNISIIVIIIGLLALCQRTITLSQNDGEGTKPPVTWKSVKFSKFFSFRIPPTLNRKQVMGYDSYVGKFSNDSMDINIDYGLYSSKFAGENKKPMYRDTTLQISGRIAKEVYFYAPAYDSLRPFIAGVYFAHVDTSTLNKLSIVAFCKTETLQDTARIIFSTIRFN